MDHLRHKFNKNEELYFHHLAQEFLFHSLYFAIVVSFVHAEVFNGQIFPKKAKNRLDYYLFGKFCCMQ